MRRENGRTKAKGFGLELVVPALCYSIRRGAVAAAVGDVRYWGESNQLFKHYNRF